MPGMLTSNPLNISDVLDAVRPMLGEGWTAYPGISGRSGVLRSHQGHTITLDGTAGATVMASALLPDGRRFPFAGQATAATTEAYATELAFMITGTLVPLHNAMCPLRGALAAATDALGTRARGTAWNNGNAFIHWSLPGGGRARFEAYSRSRDGRTGAEVLATFSDPTADEAVAVLSSVDTANADPRQQDTVHGPLAARLKAAAPGLRPVATYDRTAHDGRLTSVLTVDGLVTVELAYSSDGDAWVTGVRVEGLRHALAAVRAL